MDGSWPADVAITGHSKLFETIVSIAAKQGRKQTAPFFNTWPNYDHWWQLDIDPFPLCMKAILIIIAVQWSIFCQRLQNWQLVCHWSDQTPFSTFSTNSLLLGEMFWNIWQECDQCVTTSSIIILSPSPTNDSKLTSLSLECFFRRWLFRLRKGCDAFIIVDTRGREKWTEERKLGIVKYCVRASFNERINFRLIENSDLNVTSCLVSSWTYCKP